MTDDRDTRPPRLSRRAVLGAPAAGLAAPGLPARAGADTVALCRTWLANKAETMRLLERWGDIEAELMRVQAPSPAGAALTAGPQAAPLRAIDARLEELHAEREALAPSLPLSTATTRDGVLLKFEVVMAELFVQDFPVIYGLLHTAVRDLKALW
ncbi:hypothetical protein [Phenylobacterium sp.]|uniref:hypothetical protein n=1 Tax=Phenylobacterium sp. TaxID=1871053 RepID=UPI0025F927C6|nr:hypothetical protein [Phenylobacterium sp.]